MEKSKVSLIPYQGVSFFENFFKTGLPCFFGVLWVMNNSLVNFYRIRISFRGASRRFFTILSFAWKISFMTFLTWANFLNIHPISSCNTPFSQFFQELSFEYHICIPMTMFYLSVFTRILIFCLFSHDLSNRFEYHVCIPMTMFQLSVFMRMHIFE